MIRPDESARKDKKTNLPPEEKRGLPRIKAVLPARVTINGPADDETNCFSGKTIDLHEKGLRLSLDKPLPLSSSVNILISHPRRYGDLLAEASPIWNRLCPAERGFQTGLRVLKIKDVYLGVLKKIIEDYKSLEEKFALLVENIRGDLLGIKRMFDDFDRKDNEEKRRIDFIEANKPGIFGQLDEYFRRVWDIIKDFGKDRYAVHQDYYQQLLGELLLDPIETNRHVYRKPLGYSGDYTMMNYIYDYHRGRYLGGSSYERLINNYTCNIPIACSNIKRKNFLKESILRALKRKDGARVLSVGSGSARELTELLKENRITAPLIFKCLDPERLALDHIASTMQELGPLKTRMLSMEYICRNVTSLIRDKGLKERLRGQNLIYAFGIFDYLSDRIAAKLTEELIHLLDDKGVLVIFNISADEDSGRAYYELLGEWNMLHRTKEQMLAWTDGIRGLAEIKFEELAGGSNYLCLIITKK
jgi:extracellular factor (EF) 3-hydroxypalmitic acid methyl ester biosynthesis protein